MDCSTPVSPVFHYLSQFAQTHVHRVGDGIQQSPLSSLLLLPSTFPSIRVFSNELALHIRWPRYWTFSFSISPSSEYSGLISFRIDWLDLFAVLGALRSLPSPAPQFKSINSSALSLLYGPSLTSIHDYWKNHSFDYTDICWQSDVSSFNTLSRFAIVCLPRSKCLLISWLQSQSAVILEPKKIKSYCFHCYPIYAMK